MSEIWSKLKIGSQVTAKVTDESAGCSWTVLDDTESISIAGRHPTLKKVSLTMKTLLTTSILIFSLLSFSTSASACSAIPDGHMGVVLEIDKTTGSLTISDGETGNPVTFLVGDTVLSTEEWAVLSVEQALLVRYRADGDQLIATEIKRLN